MIAMTRATILSIRLEEVGKCLDEWNPAALTFRKIYHGHSLRDYDLPLDRARQVASEACAEMALRLDASAGHGKIPYSVVERLKERLVFAREFEDSARRLGDNSCPVTVEDLKRFEEIVWAASHVLGGLMTELMGR